MQISDQTFDGWVRQHNRLLYGIAYWWTGSRPDAEELTQEAFFQAYRSRSGLRDIGAAKGWLVGILRHCYAQMHRKGHHRFETSLDGMMEEFGDLNRSDRIALIWIEPSRSTSLWTAWMNGIDCLSCSFIFRISPIERLPKLWNCPSAP